MNAPPIALLTLLIALSGCAGTAQLLGPAPATLDGLEGNYRRIATCTFDRLGTQLGRLSKTELPERGMVRIAAMNGSEKLWELSLIDDNGGLETRLEFSSANGYALSEHVFAIARACAA